MTFKEYTNEVRKLNRAFDLIHNTMGLAGEAAEVMEIVKKRWYKTREEDRHAQIFLQEDQADLMFEEMGDVLFYFAALCDFMNFDIEDIMTANIRKLNKRHNGY